MTVDHYGDIYVADQGNDRVQLFNCRGKFVESFRGDATINKRGVDRLMANPDMLRMRDNVPEHRAGEEAQAAHGGCRCG